MGKVSFLEGWEPSTTQKQVRDCVAAICEMDPEVMVARGQTRERVQVRQLGYWVVRRAFPALSFPMIGKLFGGRDHSTIIYGIEKVEIRREREPGFREMSDAIADEIGVRTPMHVMTEDTRARIGVLVSQMAPAPEAVVAENAPAPVRAEGRKRNDFGASRHPDVVAATNMEAMIRRGTRKLAVALEREGLKAGAAQ